MEDLQLSEKIGKDAVYERLGQLLLGVSWQFEDRRRFKKGYVRFYQDSFMLARPGQPKIFHENSAFIDRKGAVLKSQHRYIVQIASREEYDQSSADLLTTFGIDVGTSSLVVGQLEGPGQDEVNPGISLYNLYGVDKLPVDEQWQALNRVLSE